METMETLADHSLMREANVTDLVPDLLDELAMINDSFVAWAASTQCQNDALVKLERRMFAILKLLREAFLELGLDFLTRLPLRGPFCRALARTLEDCQRERDPYTVGCLIIDADDLKGHNALGGHIAGDAFLRAVGQAIRANVAGVNMVSRYGGDEFAVFLPRLDLCSTETVAERIRAAVASTCGLIMPGSCSIGVALSSDKVLSVDTLIKAADDAAFTAKALGGNQVIAAV